MSIYVAGSLAFDRIMSFNGAFADHILADKLHILNVSFLIDGLVEKRGGCAGNIAYTLALMGEKPLILATAGKNFSEYGAFLESKGISLEGVRVMKDEFTASCTLITDKNNNQINGFHPAAMGFPCEYAFPHPDASADWGIVSPGNLDDMKALPRLFREKGIRYIYDPGQQIPALSGDDLLDAITGSALLVTNDYELEMISKATQRTRAELRALTGGVITTLGFMVYYGIAAAVTIRVSNFRGRNDWPAIRHASFAGLHLVMGTAAIVVLLIGIFRNIMGYIITPEKEVVELVALLAWSVILYQAGDGLQILFANALRGISDVKYMAYMAFFCHFGLALPIGYLCGFTFGWGAIGIWCGFPISLTTLGLLLWRRFNRLTIKK